VLDVVPAAELVMSVEALVLLHQPVERFGIGRPECLLDLAHVLGRFERAGERLLRLFPDRPQAVEPRFLRQVGDPQPSGRRNLARGRLFHTGNDLEYRRFPGAVHADQRHVLLFDHLKRDVAEDLLGAEGLAQIGDGQ
jgi:hypothetical protein